MLKKIFKWTGLIVSLLISIALLLVVWFNIPIWNSPGNIALGVTYSWKYAQDIGLDWQEAYLAVMDDLGAKKIRLPVYWNEVEKQEGEYDFSKTDWEIQEAQKRNVKIILTVGQKVPRWPECFIPDWASGSDQKRKVALIQFIRETVKRYKGNDTIAFWQVENEPFLNFGICPAADPDLLDSEIAEVRNLDPGKKIIVTDSGELSLWIQAAKRADVFGTTMYRTIWSKKVGYFEYPIGPRFFQFKKWLIKVFAGENEAIVIELQGEPWVDGWTTGAPLDLQFQSMDSEKLRSNVHFAQEVGFPEVYLWGAEWWYWLKVKEDHPELWETAKELFTQHEGQN